MDKSVRGIVKGLTQEPAYLLVFGLLLVVTIGAFASRLSAGLAALVTLGAFLLAAFAIALVERGKSRALPVQSKGQLARLLDLPDEELAIRGVFDGLVDNETDTYFVYSSTGVKGYVDYDGKDIDFPFLEEERQVTAIPDAFGIAKVHSLLHLAGKRRRLHIETSKSFRPEYWEANLILIGSRNANPQTETALLRYNSPFRFNEDVTAIIETQKGNSQWPERRKDLETYDYGIAVKLKTHLPEERIYLILAGIGAMGTLAVCHYLERNIRRIHEKFGNSPFACVLRVNRRQGYTSVEAVRSGPHEVFTN